jgi:hypothetical protein
MPIKLEVGKTYKRADGTTEVIKGPHTSHLSASPFLDLKGVAQKWFWTESGETYQENGQWLRDNPHEHDLVEEVRSTPTDEDLENNQKAFMFLSPQMQEEMKAAHHCGREVETLDYAGKWYLNRTPLWSPGFIYRLRPLPRDLIIPSTFFDPPIPSGTYKHPDGHKINVS